MPITFNGLRVVTFESRRAVEMSRLIERFGGHARSAPSMRELPDPESPDAPAFAEALLDGRFDVVIFLTGVGAKTLMSIIETRHGREPVVEALQNVTTVARGPKPVAAMREWGMAPTLVAPEPNTWREVLVALEEDGELDGKRVAIQEYGQPNTQLADALRERGADVTSVSIYAWGLPEDREPLRGAIAAIVDEEVEIVTFTSAQQVRNVLQMAQQGGHEASMRDALKRMVIGSIGPTTTEALRDAGLGVDFEPDRPKMGDLVRGLARSADMLLRRKRASHAAGVDTAKMRRVDAVWPADECEGVTDPLRDSMFMRACRCEPTDYTPIWIMRQAGRYQREYREIRSRLSFLELCKTPEVAAEVTLMAVDRLGVDAAIIFADILLVVEPMGVGLAFNQGEGPSIERPVRTGQDVDRLSEVDVHDSLPFVFEAIRLTRNALRPCTPLIGFSGAPFTVASYMIEGGSSRQFVQTKSLMYRDPGAWHALMTRLVHVLSDYLNAQIEAGAQAVQIFDSWVGCLNEPDYREFVLPHTRRLIGGIQAGVPVIHFGANTAMLLGAMREAGSDVLGLDFHVDLADTWAALGYDLAVQGNLDPVVLFATPSEIRRRAHAILDKVAGRPGHIFNLGHGILPNTPIDHALALIDAVHEHAPS